MHIGLHRVESVTCEVRQRRGRSDCHDHDVYHLTIVADGRKVVVDLYAKADADIGLERVFMLDFSTEAMHQLDEPEAAE